MDSDEIRFILEHYTEMKSTIAKTSVILNEFGSNIREKFHIGKLLEGTVRSNTAQFHLGVQRNLGLKRAVKSYYIADAQVVTNSVSFPSHAMQDINLIMNEIKVLCTLSHPNLIKLYEVYIDCKYIHLVMDLCKGGELFDLLLTDSIELNYALSLFIQSLEAVKYMHENGYAHRGLCLENIIFSDKEKKSIKLIGLSGASPYKYGFKLKYGSPLYMSPEVYSEKYNEKCDIWSLGVILFTMLVGHQPFQAQSYADLKQKVQRVKLIESPQWHSLDRDAKSLIKSILNTKTRPSAAELCDYPIIKKYLSQNNKIVMKRLMKTVKLARPNNNFTNKIKFSNKLKVAVYKILATKNVLQDLAALEGLWREFETNGTDVLKEAELVNNVGRILSTDLAPKAKNLIKKFDLDMKGCVSKDEFIGLLCDMSDKYVIRCAFEELDENQDGFIEADDFDRYFQQDDYEGFHRNIIDVIDSDRIDFDTLCVFINKFTIN